MNEVVWVDVVELLMVDHLSIRLLVRCGLCVREVGEFAAFHDFIVGCHARIEDEVVFPILKEHFRDVDDEFVKLVEWIGNDHKLLDTLAGNVIGYGGSGGREIYEDRLNLYFKLLMEHNLREEKQIFPIWLKELPGEVRVKATEQARKIIMEFGLRKYTEITGLSEEAFKLI